MKFMNVISFKTTDDIHEGGETNVEANESDSESN